MKPVDKPGILLLWNDPRERQALFKILRTTGADIQFGDPTVDESLAVSEHPFRLIVLDYDSVRNEAPHILKKISCLENTPAVLVVTSTRDKHDLIELFSHDTLTNLVAKNMDVNANELVVTVQKILRNDIFGFEKYLTWGVVPSEVTVTSSADKNGIIDDLDAYLSSLGCNHRLVGLAKGVADEFLMNAVYNAPIDGNGIPKYASRPRTERVDLLAGEEAVFRYACDGRTLALSIHDNFGRLERTTVLSYLRKCFLKGEDQIDDKSGGAGLGLYYIFESLNELVINVTPKKRTEMIGLIDISRGYREFARSPKSLNLFIEEAVAP